MRNHSARVAALLLAPVLLVGSLACAVGADLTTARVISSSGSAQSNVPVTFGQVFKPGDVLANATVGGRIGGTDIALQVDKKATHRDGSLRHAVITAVIPSLAANGTQTLTLNNTGSAPGGGAIALSSLLATSFDTGVSLNIGGTVYSASARELLSSGTPATWLTGPLATEWLVSGPVRSGSTAHPHLQARFYVRAYQGLGAVRVEVVVENNWARETGPRNYTYNASIDVAGRGAVFTENNVEHYRQSRWRRIAWWGTTPAVDVAHDGNYLAATRAVPNYDPRITMSTFQLDTFVSEFNANSGLMGIGNLQPYMPSPGGRNAIGPLPAWAAAYIISDDLRSKRVVVGYGQQGGAWPMHYRDKPTDLPLSIDTYPNATVIGDTNFFPACGGTCTSPYTPEASHHPSIAYLPYLITGDYYLMEELAFWSNWVLFYGPADRHGGAQGLVVWDQVRGQAWALRTLAQGAYLLPDAYPMKAYFNQKLLNNINYFISNWVDSNPLGYITNTGAAQWLALDVWISTWMDDFLTWTFGYILGMGYTEAQPVFNWKSKFPIGRMTHPDMCSILAPSYWPYVRMDRYLGGSTAFISNWADWKRGVILSHSNDAFRGTADITGREQELINAPCGSQQMASILGLGVGQMIGWFDHLSYLANMQPALAVAVDHGMPNAQAAFDKVWNSPNYALNDYSDFPQFALWPTGAVANLPVISISANPVTVTSGQTATLTWSASNATSCTASGGWAGNKPLSGTETTAPITATTTYTLTCSNSSGSSSASTSVSVQSSNPAPTLTLTANPTSIASGGSSMLTWASTNATSCTASGGWTGNRATSGTESTGALTANTTFTLSCSGAGGSIQRSATVNVQASPAPTLTLTANPTSVASGGSSMLTWASTNATSCTASGGWTGSRATSGTESTGALTANRTYALSCSGAGGSIQRSATVTVQGAPAVPTLTLTANPTSIATGGSTTLTWSTTNATSCTASGGWTGSRATSGSQSFNNLTASVVYTLQCTGAGGNVTRSAQVTVNASPPPPLPTVDLSASPLSVTANGSATLSWTSTGATTCTASGGWSGTRGTQGTESTGALSNTTNYDLTCTGPGGSSSDSVTVDVTPGGGGGGGGTTESDSGGGALGWLSLAFLACEMARRRRVFARSAAA
jgi:hypothetical protein